MQISVIVMAERKLVLRILEGSIACDCLERGRMRRSAPAEWGLHVGSDGFRDVSTKDPHQEDQFVDWNETSCEHDQGNFVKRTLCMEIESKALHAHLARRHLPTMLSLLLAEKDAGWDTILPARRLQRLKGEPGRLADIHLPGKIDDALLRLFEARLCELVGEALAMGKPIRFTLDSG